MYSAFNLALEAEPRGGSCAGTLWAAALGMWFFFSGTRSVRWYVAAPYMLAACGTCSSLCGLRRYVAAPYTQHSVMNAAPYKRPAVVSGGGLPTVAPWYVSDSVHAASGGALSGLQWHVKLSTASKGPSEPMQCDMESSAGHARERCNREGHHLLTGAMSPCCTKRSPCFSSFRFPEYTNKLEIQIPAHHLFTAFNSGDVLSSGTLTSRFLVL